MSFICSEIILCHVCTCTCTEGRRLDHVLDTQAQADFEVWFVHVFFLMALYFGCPHVVSGMSGDALKKDITIIVRHTRTLFIFLQYWFIYTFWFRLQTLMCAQSSCDSILTTRSTHSEHYARFGTSNNLKNSENIVPSSKPRQMCIIDIARTEEVTLNLLAIIGHQNYVSKTTDNNCENL